MVHKGEMIASDGTVKAVAIKTIKCKFCYNILLYNMWIIYIAPQLAVIVKPGTLWPLTDAWLVCYNCFCLEFDMCLWLCMSSTEAINHQWCDMDLI